MLRKAVIGGMAGLAAVAAITSLPIAPAQAGAKPLSARQSAPELSLNVRAQSAADRIMNADDEAVTGKPSTATEPQAAVHDTSFAGMTITATGLQVSVAGKPSAALLSAIKSQADGIPVTIRTVAHSELQLQAVVTRIGADSANWAKRGVHISVWGPDTGSDKVNIFLSRYAPAAAARLIARYGKAWVTVSDSSAVAAPSASRTDDGSPWWGGDEVEHAYTSGGKNYYSICTTGFNLDIGGSPYISTADHCFEDDFSTDFFNPGGTFGSYYGWAADHDVVVIPVAAVGGWIWSDPTSTDRQVVNVATSDPVGGLICTDGLSDREVCSVKIESVDQSLTYTINGSPTKVVNAVYACTTTGDSAFSGGDSGGPVETTLGSSETNARGEVIAHVVVNGVAENNCGWYMPQRYMDSGNGWTATVVEDGNILG
jgi:hypothetical protein